MILVIIMIENQSYMLIINNQSERHLPTSQSIKQNLGITFQHYTQEHSKL